MSPSGTSREKYIHGTGPARQKHIWPRPAGPAKEILIWLPQAGPAKKYIFEPLGRAPRKKNTYLAPSGRPREKMDIWPLGPAPRKKNQATAPGRQLHLNFVVAWFLFGRNFSTTWNLGPMLEPWTGLARPATSITGFLKLDPIGLRPEIIN